jgi:hypothetical protein
MAFGDRLTSLTRSLRVSKARFRTATGWAPRYPSARALSRLTGRPPRILAAVARDLLAAA